MLIQINTQDLRRCHKIICIAFIALFILNAFVISFASFTGHYNMLGVFRLFYFNSEANFPTFLSVFNEVFAAFLLFYIYRTYKENKLRYAKYWLILSIGFLYLAIDDFTQIHESASVILQEYFHTGGWFYYAWVIPAIMIIALSGGYFLRFYLQLPVRYKLLFGLSMLLFLMGALGMELISGQFAPDRGFFDMKVAILATIEQSIQWIGGIVFLYAITDYMQFGLAAVRTMERNEQKNIRVMNNGLPRLAGSRFLTRF